MFEEFKSLDCKQKILSLAWKPRGCHIGNNQNSALDKNKFVISSSSGEIKEFTFIEKSFNVLDISCKGEICLSVQSPSNLNDVQIDKKVHTL